MEGVNPQRTHIENTMEEMRELHLGAYVTYVCGGRWRVTVACGEENEKKPVDDIICQTCSSKVLFKKRRGSGIQCEAR